jgi:glutamyl-tRNA synthetase
LSDFDEWFAVLHGEVDPAVLSHEERLFIRDAAAAAEKLDWDANTWRTLTGELKQSSGRKGRDLFHPLRLALTGRDSGPEMAGLLETMGRDRALRRLEAAAKR